ncbi:MAG TPA: cytochrome P450 [Verrucomicrobiae bacterium]|nr:cytochrome P450 [Verrucomicrobiae bacterium]
MLVETKAATETGKPQSSAGEPRPSRRRLPPGPRGLPYFGVGFQFAYDPLGLLERVARAYGDITEIRAGFMRRVLINHPDLITQVLIIQQNKFQKSEITRQLLGELLGQGLLTSEGDFWRRQRRLAQPAFRRSRINEYAPTMVQVAEETMHGWRNGQVTDIVEQMMALTLEVAVRALFGTTLPSEAAAVGRATTFLMRYQLGRMRSPLRLPKNWPTAANRRAERERQVLDKLVYRVIEQKQASVKQPSADSCPHHASGSNGNRHDDDVLSLLMAAMDEDGSQMTPQQLRDETMTLFLAGHETTALSLAWTWYLLGENPKAEARLQEELHGVLGGRMPEAADLERLPYLRAVVDESLRLYSPASLMSRMSIAPFSLGGYDFPTGTTVLMSQWIMHRDPRFYDDPNSFRPERWLAGLEDRLPKGAYFPFGDGPRRCIGQDFAILDTMLVLAAIAQKFSFRLVPGHPIVPEQLVTLRPRHGIKMTIQERK